MIHRRTDERFQAAAYALAAAVDTYADHHAWFGEATHLEQLLNEYRAASSARAAIARDPDRVGS